MRRSVGRVAIQAISAALFLSGCFLRNSPESFPVQRKLVRQIEQTCTAGDSCRVRMRDVTGFAWDRMLVFAVGVTPAERKKAVGVEGVETIDLDGELVFTNDGKIVHQEPLPEGVEEPIKNEIWFAELTNTGQYATYSSDVVFRVARSTSRNGPSFSLSPIP